MLSKPVDEDDHVGGALRAVLGDDAPGRARGPLGDQVHVGALERRVVVVGDQDPLAADHMVRGEGAAQLRVGDLLGQLTLAHADPQPPHRLELVERGDEDLEEEPLREAREEPARGGNQRKRRLLPAAVGAVLLRDHVRGRALVDVEMPDAPGDRRYDLDGAGARADHGHPLALELDFVVPARRVEDVALEAIGARDRVNAGRLSWPQAETRTSASSVSPRPSRSASARSSSSKSARRPRSRGAGCPASRTCRRTAPGSRGSPAAASSGGSNPDWARRRTSRGAMGTSQAAPG